MDVFVLNREPGSLQDARDQECYKHFDIPKKKVLSPETDTTENAAEIQA